MFNVCRIIMSITLDTLDIYVYTLDVHAPNIEQKPMEGVMARAFTEETRAEQLANRTFSSAVQYEWTCTRCGGLMVNDSYIDLLNSVGESKFAAKRCVQCGEVVDPVILRNRGARQEPMVAHSALF